MKIAACRTLPREGESQQTAYFMMLGKEHLSHRALGVGSALTGSSSYCSMLAKTANSPFL